MPTKVLVFCILINPRSAVSELRLPWDVLDIMQSRTLKKMLVSSQAKTAKSKKSAV
jgi:hypothetical protein